MYAIGVTEYGSPDVLRRLEVPDEPVGAGQVRVKVTAATVNPADTSLRSGRRATGPRPPSGFQVPGWEVAGTLIEIGEGVDTDLVIGDRVMGIVVPNEAHGGYRDDIVLPVRSVSRAPAAATDVQAATIPMNGLTAQFSLDLLGLAPGQVLAVTGGAGGFGGYLIQLAKLAGLQVVADASEEDEALVRELGAQVVVRRGPDLAARIRLLYPEGVDGLADGAVLDAAALPAVRDGGAVVTVRGYTGDGQRGLRVTPVWVRQYAEESAKLERLRRLVDDGDLTLRVAGTHPASDAAQAHHRLERGGTRGRLVLEFD